MGKRGNFTRAEQKWIDFLLGYGCMICRSPPQIHHILTNGRRPNHHFYTIPLCFHHHQGGRNDPEVTSRHPWKRAFEARYGTEAELLARVRQAYIDRYGSLPHEKE